MKSQLSAEVGDAIGKLMDARGATLIAFAQVEWFLAKIILEASKFVEYKNLDLSFSQDAAKRAERLREILKVSGPFSPFADELLKHVEKVLTFEELRHFSAHGLQVVPQNITMGSPIYFSMFRMIKGGEIKEERLKLTLKQYTEQQGALTGAAREFIVVVRKVWADLKLSDLDPAPVRGDAAK